MSRMVCECGQPLEDGMGFCSPCRESLGLPPVPKPIKPRWSEKKRMAFRERVALLEDLQRRIAALPDPVIGDPFIGVYHQNLSVGMRHTGAGGLR